MRDELIAAVARGANLTPEQATQAVAAVLRFLTARLPSSLVGELHSRLQTRGRGAPVNSSGLSAAGDPELTP